MTDKDYADKEWLRSEDDGFQLIDPYTAAVVFLVGLGFATFLDYLDLLWWLR